MDTELVQRPDAVAEARYEARRTLIERIVRHGLAKEESFLGDMEIWCGQARCHPSSSADAGWPQTPSLSMSSASVTPASGVVITAPRR